MYGFSFSMKVKKTIEKRAQLAFYLVLIRKQVGSPR